jgi:hypothetical protein
MYKIRHNQSKNEEYAAAGYNLFFMVDLEPKKRSFENLSKKPAVSK